MVLTASTPAPPRDPRVGKITSRLADLDFDQAAREEEKRLESRPIAIQFGDDVSQAVQKRVFAHLQGVPTAAVELIDAKTSVDELDEHILAIGIGDTAITRALIDPKETADLGDEGYILRSQELERRSAIAVKGTSASDKKDINAGTHFGAFALLEELGFAFLHPLEPTPPLAIPGQAPPINRKTSPRWPIRGLQLHTMHPLELTDLLQGFGPEGPDDEKGWETLLDDWDHFLDWMLANGQNRVHWVWLAATSWLDFANSQERIGRIKTIVEKAQALGIQVGLDVPLRFQQQNSGRLIRKTGHLADELRQIEDGVAHIMQAGFDYLVTESGSTEFTAVPAERMLQWMDALTRTAEEDHGVPVFIKVHASTGQHAKGFLDPETKKPLNFNFLPHYADERLGVLPHSIQHYSLSDPAPTYGNEDFGHLRTFLQQQAGRRPTVWHPETAYWVSFDNDVPLFLPVYASRRVHDLRLLGSDEEAGRMGRGDLAGSMMDGQLTFSSGWEWGYWLQEVVTARAAWDPKLESASDNDALRRLLTPIERAFGDAGPALANWLVDYAQAQKDLLIDGIVDGQAPESVVRRNGQAYLQGWETWDDLSHMLADRLGLESGRMQPERLNLVELRRRPLSRFEYRAHVAPLLDEMEQRFTALARRLESLRNKVPISARGLFEEIVDAAQITSLRARQVQNLYAFVDADARGLHEEAQLYLNKARNTLDQALALVAHRELHYRVPTERIAAWRKNPTVYPFTYLWTVRSLFYWQRDEAQATKGSINPCLFNIINPIDVVHNDGTLGHWTKQAGHTLRFVPALAGTAKCMAAPKDGPPLLPVQWQHELEDPLDDFAHGI